MISLAPELKDVDYGDFVYDKSDPDNYKTDFESFAEALKYIIDSDADIFYFYDLTWFKKPRWTYFFTGGQDVEETIRCDESEERRYRRLIKNKTTKKSTKP